MSNYSSLIGGDSSANRLIDESRDAGAIFRNATWDQVGTDKELTKFLHQSLDPNGDKYGGSTDALKEDMLNTITTRGSSAMASVWDFIGAKTEGQQSKQFNNLAGRLYEDAPNRLVSGDAGDTYQAIKSGLIGGVLYDAPALLAMAPVKVAMGVGALASKTFGTNALRAAGESVVAAGAKGMAAEEATSLAGRQLTRDLTVEGFKTGAKEELIENTVLGGIGDVAQQNASMERGLQDEFSYGQAGLNLAGGGLVGAGLGGAVGAIGGRISAGKAVGNIPQAALDAQGRIDAAAAAKAEADAALLAPAADPAANALTAQQDASRELISSAYGEVNILANRLAMGKATSTFAPEQLRVLTTVLSEFERAGNKVAYHTNLAETRTKQGEATGNTRLLDQAAENMVKAQQYQGFVDGLEALGYGDGSPSIAGANDEAIGSLVNLIGSYDQRVAEAFGAATPAKTPKAGKTAAAASTPTAAAAPAPAAIAPTQQAAPNVPPAASDASAPMGVPAAPDVPAAPLAPVTADEIVAIAETGFSMEEKAALAALKTNADKAGVDLQTAIDKIAAGAEGDMSKEPLNIVTAAAERERAKAAPAVAPAATTMTQAAPTAQADAMAAVEQQAADVAAVMADNQTMIDAIGAVEGGDTELAKMSALDSHTAMVKGLNDSVASTAAVLDDALVQVKAMTSPDKTVKIDKAEKVAKVQAALDKARADYPELAPLLDRLDASKMTSDKGVDNAKLQMQEMANQAVDFTYARVIGDVLPDATNVGDFDVVLRGMLEGAPSDELNRISASYRKMVYNALVDRIEAIGIANVQKDPKLGAAWNRLVNGDGGWQSHGGKSKVAVDVGAIVNKYTSQIVNSITGGAHEFHLKMDEVGGVVRNFMQQLEASGIPMDSQFMAHALDMRAMRAVHDAIEGTFKLENKEAYDKIAQIKALKESERGGRLYTRTNDQARNPFFDKDSIMENPVLHRVSSGQVDEYGDDVMVDLVVSGRQINVGKDGKKTVGKPQGMFSDGISDYLGLLWSHPKKMFSAIGAARRSILGASVDAASWSQGTMMIGGQKFRGPIKMLKGLYAETANARAEQSRMALILDAEARRRLPVDDPRYLGADAHKAHLEKIGALQRPVTKDEQYVAEMMFDHKERIANNNEAAQKEMADILADSAALGERSSDKIQAIVAKLNKSKAGNDATLLEVLENFKSKAEQDIGSRSKTVKGADGTKVKENSATGTAAVEKPFVARESRMKVNADGTVTPSTRDTSRYVTLPVRTDSGVVKKEFLPADWINLTADGNVMLFGEKIGTWIIDMNVPMESRRPIVMVKGAANNGYIINDLSALSNASLVRDHADLFKRNADKLTDYKGTGRDGSAVDKPFSETAKVDAAKESLINPSSVKDADLSQTIASFAVPADRTLVFRSKATGAIQRPGPLQGGMTISAFLSRLNIDPNEVELGTMSLDKKNKQFISYGRDTGTVDADLLKSMATKKDNAVPMLKAQNQAISFAEAEKIDVDGRSLAQVVSDFDKMSVALKWETIGSLEDLNSRLAYLEREAKLIESLAPHGLKRDNASRRQSFGWLQAHMAQFSEGERMAALDLLRRIDPSQGQLPYFTTGAENQFSLGYGADAGKSGITLGANADAATPKHIAVIHETGHWAFANMLSPSEKLEFVRSLAKYYNADGRLDMNLVLKAMPNATAIESAIGKKLADLRTGTNELFAWQFTNHAMNTMVGKPGADAELGLWKKITKYVKGMIEHFLGQKVDPDLLPLFERILPSSISENKFNYSSILGKDGKPLDIAAITDPVQRGALGSITDVMSKVDGLRSKLGQVMLTPGGLDAGYTEEVRSAAKYMFGLLRGRTKGVEATKTVSGIRSKLSPFRELDGDDKWERDTTKKLNAAGKYPIKKDAEGKPVVKKGVLFGAIDPRDLFQSNGAGKLMQAIHDVMPEKGEVADNIAFEAASGAEAFSLTLKSTSRQDMPDVEFTYNQALEQEFNRKVSAGVEPEAALDQADAFAAREAASYAKETYGIDIESSVFDEAGARVTLGTPEQQAVLNNLGRKLYDLMGDAIDHLQKQAEYKGAFIQRSAREVARVEPTAESKAIEAVVAAKVKTPKKVKTQAPANDASAAVVAREASERVDGNATGVPSAAPELWGALISRVTHRDADQQDIIGTLMYRVFSHVFGSKTTDLSNSDIVRLSGMSDDTGLGGHKANALASTGTPAFESLRGRFRIASEALTNKDKNPEAVTDLLLDLLSAGKADELNTQLDIDGFALTDNVADVGARGLRDSDVAFFLRDLRKGVDRINNKATTSVEIRQVNIHRLLAGNEDLINIVGSAEDMLVDLGKTARAKRVLGDAVVAEPGAPVIIKMSNDSYHPYQAKAAAEARVGKLPKQIVKDLLARIGEPETANIADFIGYRMGRGRKVYATYRELLDSITGDIDGLNAEIAHAFTDAPENVATLMSKRNAMMDAVGVELDNVSLVLMKDGFGTKDLEKQIAEVSALVRNKDAGDTPLTGSIVLHMAMAEDVRVNPLAAEQTALQAGAPRGIARIFGNIFKSKRSADGLTDSEAGLVKSFSGLQMSTQSVRIRNIGATWLADAIDPVNGTGFQEALMTRMSADLLPLVAQLDKLTGVESWYKKAGYEVYRNLDMRKNAVPQAASEMRIAMAMRTSDMTGLTLEERTVMNNINEMFRKLLVMQNDAGIPVGDVTNAANRYYLPQRMNVEWIRAHTDEAVQMLGDWFKKDRAGTGTEGTAMKDAKKVIFEAMNREELQGMVDSSNSTYAQAFGDKLHSRNLRIVGKDWEKMAPMFDNNLRSLLASYAESAHTRVRWSERFGVKGHAADTYVDIAHRGALAAIDALQSKASGIKYTTAVRAAGESDLPSHQRDVEFVSTLFSAATRDQREAERMVAFIAARLTTDKSEATRSNLVEQLVAKFENEGGAGAMHFRKRAEAIVNGLADFGDAGGTIANHEMDFMLKTVGTLGGRPAYTFSANQTARNLALGVKTFNSVTLLAGATLSSFGDTVLPLIRAGSLSNALNGTVKAVRMAMNDPATAAAMMRVGVIGETIVRENIVHASNGAASRLTNAFFQGTLLTPWTNAMRQYSALVGFESIKANQAIVQREAMAGNVDSWKYRKSMRYLRQLGLGYLAQADKLDDLSGAVSGKRMENGVEVDDLRVAEAIHKFTNESVFQPNRNDMPLWTQDPIASILWQFKSFPTMMGRLAKRTIKEAIATEKGNVFQKGSGKYEGDPSSLMYLLTIGAAAGAGASALKETIRGSNEESDGSWHSPRTHRLSKMGQDLGFKDFSIESEGADALLGSYANGLLSLGALGFLGDLMYQSAKQVDNGTFGRERIVSQIFGPTYGTFSDTIQIVEGAHDALSNGVGEGSAKQRNAVRKIVKRVPLPGGSQNAWAEEFVNNTVGESNVDPSTPGGWSAW